MDRKQVKQLSKELGVSYRDLIALAPQNDPFYCGSPSHKRDADWFADIWNRAGYINGVHLRRVHYWIVSQPGAIKMPLEIKLKNVFDKHGDPVYSDVYINHDSCWIYLNKAAKHARYLGLVRVDDMVDNKNPDPHIAAKYDWSGNNSNIDVPDFERPSISIWGRGFSSINAQPYHLEVWCEKSTMDDVLLPVCRQFNANLVTFEGEVSLTACNDLIKRIKRSGGKPTRVFYISDFDPAGNSMPVAMSRKVEFELWRDSENYNVKITPLVLTFDQVKEYKLPRAPIKDSERRAASFEEAFGEGATELDALEVQYPGELARLTSAALAEYYSNDAHRAAWDAEQELRLAIRKRIDEVTVRYKPQIEAIEAMAQELRAIKVEPEDYAVSTFEPHQINEDDWLFDSGRSYLEQIDYYKQHKAMGQG